MTFEVIRYSLMNTNVEHGQTLQRLCVSPVTMITRDFQPSILTESGELVFLGPYLQYFSNAQALTIKWILENRAADPGIEPGDMFLSNDPYVGTPHQPDTIVAAPVFVGDELFCWVANVLHHADVGGSVMGSFCVDAADIFTDPPAFPPFKIVSRGEVRRIWSRCSCASRGCRPRCTWTCAPRSRRTGSPWARSTALVDRYGADAVKTVMNRVIDAGEGRWRNGCRRSRTARGSHRLYAEASHTGDTGLYRYQLTVRKQGDELVVDNAGTDPQAGSINVTYAGLVGAFLSALTASLTADLAGAYGGVYRRVRFEPVPGTLSCADFPAAVSPAGVYTMETLISLSGTVIAQDGGVRRAGAAPGSRSARRSRTSTAIISGGVHPTGAPFIAVNANNMIGSLAASPRRRRRRLRRPLLDPRGHRQQHRGDRAALADAVPVPPGADGRRGRRRAVPRRAQHHRSRRSRGPCRAWPRRCTSTSPSPRRSGRSAPIPASAGHFRLKHGIGRRRPARRRGGAAGLRRDRRRRGRRSRRRARCS